MSVTQTAALWGLCGAFIYAAPRWSACAFTAKGKVVRCTVEALTSLLCGTAAAASFASWIQHFLGQPDGQLSAVAALVGLLANPVAPKVVDGLGVMATNSLLGRVTKALKEKQNEP